MIKALVYNEDIAEIKKKSATQNLTSLELNLLYHEGWNEHKVQSAAKIYFDNLDQELEMKNIGRIFFFQIDNGANNLSAGAKIRKWQEGTRPGMPDACILAWSNESRQQKCWFIEFKRIDSKNAIEGNKNTKTGLKKYVHFQKQLAVQDRLRKMGSNVHLTNNVVYCENVIAKEIKWFMGIL